MEKEEAEEREKEKEKEKEQEQLVTPREVSAISGEKID